MMSPVITSTPVSVQDAGVVASARCSRLSFSRTARVRAKAEFSRVFETGKRTAEPRLALHWLADSAPSRLGLAVSRKVDPHAVGRNRIKRALREAFRSLRPRLRGGAYVVVARSGAARAEGLTLQEALEQLLLRAGALPPAQGVGTMPPATSHPFSDAAAPVRGPEPVA